MLARVIDTLSKLNLICYAGYMSYGDEYGDQNEKLDNHDNDHCCCAAVCC